MRRPRWLLPHEMPRFSGLEIPRDFYSVTACPAPLAGMRRPSAETPWEALAEAGFHSVICLTDDHPAYDASPLRILHAVALEDLYGGLIPSRPAREQQQIEAAARTCLDALRHGDGVVVHCAGGTGRTGTLLAVVLCRLGGNPEDVFRYLDAVNRERGTGWPESSWQADVVRRLVLETD